MCIFYTPLSTQKPTDCLRFTSNHGTQIQSQVHYLALDITRLVQTPGTHWLLCTYYFANRNTLKSLHTEPTAYSRVLALARCSRLRCWPSVMRSHRSIIKAHALPSSPLRKGRTPRYPYLKPRSIFAAMNLRAFTIRIVRDKNQEK
jgi:hypothetical protein